MNVQDPSLRLHRRRQVCRKSQKRFREKQKRLEKETRDRVSWLTLVNDRIERYHNVLRQGQLFHHSKEIRRLNLEMYSDLMAKGIDPKRKPVLYQQQSAFLALHFDPRFALGSNASQRGYDVLKNQWIAYTTLFDGLQAQVTSIEQVDEASEIFNIHTQLTLVITHRAIVALYPHMGWNYKFLHKSIGKPLTLKLTQHVEFNANGRIQSMDFEMNTTTGWTRLLQDGDMVALLLSQQQLEKEVYISPCNIARILDRVKTQDN